MARKGGRVFAAVVFLLIGIRPAAAETALDEFEDLLGWTATASDGARVEIARDAGHTGMGMRIDFDIGAGGYVIVRKAFPISLPSNYAFKFFVRGDASPNTFEFKLIDRHGENVWWYNQRGFSFPTEWRQIAIKKPRLAFAWGPAGGGPPKQVGYIEIAISAGTGGKGSVWIDDLQLEEREAPARGESPPKVSASTSVPDHEPERVLDQDLQTSWRSGSLAANQWLLVDFLKPREYGGLVIDWDPEDYATSYRVQVSDDGESWTPVYSSQHGHGGRDYVCIPDGESRYVRLDLDQSSRGQGYAIRTLMVEPFEFSGSPNQFFEAVAKDAPTGLYPKYFSGTQTYWTVVGTGDDGKQGLLNEEGMLEVDKSAFSIEPFLYADGLLIDWNTVHTAQTLGNGYLPIPSVTWQHDKLALTVTVFGAGKPGASALYARYQVHNADDAHRVIDLFLTIRPFQVLPPWQSLNMVGGVTLIHDLAFEPRTAWVNKERAVISLTPPDGIGAATFDEGSVTDFLVHDKVPPRAQVSDPLGYASGALQYHMSLAPGAQQDVYLVIPFHDPDAITAAIGTDGAAANFKAQLDDTTREWESVLGHIDLQLPATAAQIVRTLKSTVAYILINRDGPALRPGTRNYGRAWIRDGAMTATALLEMGCPDAVQDFLRWFAQYQFADGRIPCCVDARGADRVPENDSDGEFVYAVAEYYRFTRDVGFVSEMWPAIVRAVGHMAALRQQRLTDGFTHPDKQAFYGLIPESISHEGYSGHPVHSYWDDFFALRGFKDAASLAPIVGDDEHAAGFVALRDAFQTDLYASIARSMTEHGIDYVPGSAELGDFDPTSTAIALTLCSEQSRLPEAALTHTFNKYWEHVQEREHAGTQGDDAYTPYELRNVGAFVRLGDRVHAVQLLDILLAGQRPPAWNGWAEVVWRDPSAPRFIGDMPHTWVGSSFITSVRSMLAFERDADRALVVAAGVPATWVTSESGMTVKRLPTHYGVLNYTLRSEGANAMRLIMSGDLTVPPGNIVIQPPLPQPLKTVTVNGKAITSFKDDSATISEFPAEVVLEY